MDAQTRVAQLKQLLEEEQQLNLQLEEKIVESKAKLQKIEDQTIKEMEAYAEMKKLQLAIQAIAEELDTDTTRILRIGDGKG